MTWNALCPGCHGRSFVLTESSVGMTEIEPGNIHVNCAAETCGIYIGQIDRATILHQPDPEPH